MLDADLKEHLQNLLDTQILETTTLSGGDINAAFMLKTEVENLVIKLNDKDKFPEMFAREAEGLKLLSTAEAFHIPKVHLHGEFGSRSFLVMEYIAQGQKGDDFWMLFGKNLARLHQQSQPQFGLDEDNYIGSLPQYNSARESAADFYIEQRLEPQFRMASDRGYSFKDISAFFKKAQELIPKEPPALIHGDLWSGNYLVNASGKPALIDPAVAYSPREMDIGMMHLFGGFDQSLYKSYQAVFPFSEGWHERIKLWQLYFVLVHVNLFGGGYFASAKAIMEKYL